MICSVEEDSELGSRTKGDGEEKHRGEDTGREFLWPACELR